MTVISAMGAADGFYPVEVRVANLADPVHEASGTVTYVVDAPVEPAVNNPPVARNDEVVLLQKSAIEIAVLSNDFDPDGDALSITAFTDGSKGTVSLNADGTLTYLPGKRFKTSDSFGYTVTDGEATASATVRVTLEEAEKVKPGGGKGRR